MAKKGFKWIKKGQKWSKKGSNGLKKGQKGGKVKLKSSLKLGEIKTKIVNYNVKNPQTAQKTANYS